jgi:hypothetical protein
VEELGRAGGLLGHVPQLHSGVIARRRQENLAVARGAHEANVRDPACDGGFEILLTQILDSSHAWLLGH